jgi:glycolate oxidase iron-sulfur subunit
MNSPRGRIYLARAVAEGDLLQTAAVERHWDLCLQCRACEAACPSGVAYGRIMEHVRAQVGADPRSKGAERRLRRLVLRHVVARPQVLAMVTAPARWTAAVLGDRRPRLPGMAGRLLAQLPRGQGSASRRGLRSPATRPGRKVTMLTGCVMGELFGEVHRATARVLNRRGVSVEAPAEQVCCGALHAHDGDLAFARMLARRNIAAFEACDPEAVIVNSAGCGAAMKEYGDLLAGDPRWAVRAQAFATRVRDLSEYLAELGMTVPARYAGRVTYQDACHLVHAQGIRAQPRQLLAAIDGMDLAETGGADRCCGAAGIYSLVQPEMSAELRRRKADELRASGAETIVTANPGCQLQYLAACAEAGLDAEVLHIAELLDRAEAAVKHPTS